MKKILVVGSANTDMIVKVDHLPKKGETILGQSFYKLPGGKGANQAVAARRAGGSVTFLACVGDDSLGEEAIAGYQQDGIVTTDIQKIPTVSTGVALITVDQNGNNTIAVASGANAKLSAEKIQSETALIQSSDILLLQLETPLEGVIAAIHIAHEAKQFIILNPAPARDLPNALLAKVNLITPNETEAEILTGIKVVDEASAKRAADYLLSLGVEKVMITLGENGLFYADQSHSQHFPSYKVSAVDTTAAGDTFNGALAAALAKGKPTDAALQFAQAASALSVTKIGAQSAIPRLNEIEAFL